MLAEILQRGVALAHRRAGLVLWDILWKTLWLVFSVAAVLLVVAWYGAEVQGLSWEDTGIPAVNGLMAAVLAREFWNANKAEILLAFAAVVLVSIAGWFLLESYFHRKFVKAGKIQFPLLSKEGWPRQQENNREATADGAYGVVTKHRNNLSEIDHHPVCAAKDASRQFHDRAATPPRRGGEKQDSPVPTFGSFLISRILKTLFLACSAILLSLVFFNGAPLLAAIIFLSLAFCLSVIETLIRAGAVELAGTDLIRVTGLLGILMSFELTIAAALGLLLTAGFLNVARLMDALVMLGVTGLVVVFLTLLHSYLLLVRFSAIAVMRQHAVEI
jgi:hypothetical protein